jgi:hypothetical protein
MPQFRVSAFELNHHDRALVASLMALAESKTRGEWFWVDNIAAADVVFAPDSGNHDHVALEERLAADGGPQKPIYLVDAANAPIEGRLTMQRPPRLADVIRCLNTSQSLIEARSSRAEKLETSEFSSLYPALVSVFKTRAPGMFVLRGKPWAPIYVMPMQRMFLSVADDDTMRATLTATDGPVTIESITDENELLRLLQGTAEPAAKLIWLAAITLPQAHQAGYIDAKRMYQLKRSPSLEGLMHREADLRMSNILTETPMTARGLALLSGASTSGARSFLMAAYAAGLLSTEKTSETGEPAAPPPVTTSAPAPTITSAARVDTASQKEPLIIRFKEPRDGPPTTG